jgi:hypothetical protein
MQERSAMDASAGDRFSAFFHGHRFASQRRLVDAQVLHAQQSQVGRHARNAGLQQYDIARARYRERTSS